jgi:hypothetical protein
MRLTQRSRCLWYLQSSEWLVLGSGRQSEQMLPRACGQYFDVEHVGLPEVLTFPDTAMTTV